MITPKKGWIGLTQISGKTGWLIRAMQWLNGDGYENFEHVLIVSDVVASESGGDPLIMVIEAEPGGAVEVPFHYDLATTVWVETPDEFCEGVVTAARSYLHVGYSFLDYFACFLRRMHIWVPGLREYIRSTKHMICSQLADRACADAGWHIFDRVWEGYVTPGKWWKFWRQMQTAKKRAV